MNTKHFTVLAHRVCNRYEVIAGWALFDMAPVEANIITVGHTCYDIVKFSVPSRYDQRYHIIHLYFCCFGFGLYKYIYLHFNDIPWYMNALSLFTLFPRFFSILV